MNYAQGISAGACSRKGQEDLITSQVLEGALELLHDGDGWTHHAFARNSDGDIVPVHNEDAVAWCIRGAICRATHSNRIGDDFNFARDTFGEQIGGVSCGIWNDDPIRKFGQVRETFRRAISSAQLREGRGLEWGGESLNPIVFTAVGHVVSPHGIPDACPGCNCKPMKLEVRDYDPLWQEGHVHCALCGYFLRDYDSSS